MKILLTILYIIIGLIALLLVIALFVKKEYTVKREVVINKSKQEVFDYIKFQKNQDHYNKWWMADPNARKEFRGVDGTVGFTTYWNSENNQVGEGEQEITRIVDGERVDCVIRFVRPFKNVADVSMTTEAISPTQTRLVWVFAGKNKYPMNLMNLFIDKMLGTDLETSIHNLKREIEK